MSAAHGAKFTGASWIHCILESVMMVCMRLGSATARRKTCFPSQRPLGIWCISSLAKSQITLTAILVSTPSFSGTASSQGGTIDSVFFRHLPARYQGKPRSIYRRMRPKLEPRLLTELYMSGSANYWRSKGQEDRLTVASRYNMHLLLLFSAR